MAPTVGFLSLGIGKSSNRSARQAGREAARLALEKLGPRRPDLILAFATAGYDQQRLLDGIVELTGSTPLSGCSTSGVLTADGLDENSHAVAVMAIASDQLRFHTYQLRGLAQDSRASGRQLAKELAPQSRDGRLLLLFPDGVTGSVTHLVEALQADLPSRITVVGGTAGALLKLDQTWQYHDGAARSDAVSAVLISGELTPEITVTHGCEPVGKEQTVTRAENGWVYEIDGQPAWSVYRRYLELGENQALSMGDSCFICLAEHLPEPDPRYGEYIIRCPLQLDKDKGALFFPGDIETGSKVRMALRNTERTVALANASAESIVARHPGERPAVVLQFDCCCRGQLLFGEHAHRLSVDPLQRIFGPEIPWFGFSTYGELAPLPRGKTLFHNYTTVLCALYPQVPTPQRA